MSKQIVEQVKAELVARGQRWQTNEDAFQITGRVAWLLRDQGAKLIVKRPEQNGANVWGQLGAVRVSHDSIAFPSGWKDVLISAGPPDNFNIPTWGHTDASGATLLAPFDMDAGVNVPVVPPTVPAAPVAPSEPQPAPVNAWMPDCHGDIEVRLKAVEESLLLLQRAIGALYLRPDAIYDIPYDIKAPWPIGVLKGTITATPRKR